MADVAGAGKGMRLMDTKNNWKDMSFTLLKKRMTAAVVVLGLSATGLCLSLPAGAEPVITNMAETIEPPTTSIYMDLLYHKMTNQKPDFDAWALDSKDVKAASEHDRPIVFTRVSNQLRDIFEDLDPSDYIIVRNEVNVAKSYSELQETIFFEEFGPETFIEYPSTQVDRKYALVLKGIDKYAEISMRKDKADEMLKKLGHGGDAHVEIVVKPLAADAETPFEYGGESYWLIMGEVAEFNLWSDRRTKEKVWSDHAEWYEEENPLMDLYSTIPKK